MISSGSTNCQRCGDPIPAKRLAAVPDATKCVPCQRRYDLSPAEQLGTRVFQNAMAVTADVDPNDFGFR